MPKTPLRATLLAICALTGSATWAQSWPEKAITIVVPTQAGGANDAIARIIGQLSLMHISEPTD